MQKAVFCHKRTGNVIHGLGEKLCFVSKDQYFD